MATSFLPFDVLSANGNELRCEHVLVELLSVCAGIRVDIIIANFILNSSCSSILCGIINNPDGLRLGFVWACYSKLSYGPACLCRCQIPIFISKIELTWFDVFLDTDLLQDLDTFIGHS